MTREQLRDRLIQKAQDLSGQLALSVGETQLLLTYFNWSEDKLQNSYFDDIEKYQERAGIVKAEEDDDEGGEDKGGVFSCTVCLEDVPMKDTYALVCGHRYCTECWGGYLKEAVSKLGHLVYRATCMHPECKAVIPFDAWEKLSSKEDYDKYWYFMLKSFVEQDKKYIMCPSCDLILCNKLFRSGSQKSGTCKCGKKLWYITLIVAPHTFFTLYIYCLTASTVEWKNTSQQRVSNCGSGGKRSRTTRKA